MKSIVASLLTIYIATNGQNIPNSIPPPEPPLTAPLPALVAMQTEPPVIFTPPGPPQELPNNPNPPTEPLPPIEPPVGPVDPPAPVDPVPPVGAPEPPLAPPVGPVDPPAPVDPVPPVSFPVDPVAPPQPPVDPAALPQLPAVDPLVAPPVDVGAPPVDPSAVPPVDPATITVDPLPATPIDPAATGPITPVEPAAVPPLDPSATGPNTPATPVTPVVPPITPAPTTPAPTMNPYCTPGLATMAQQYITTNGAQGYTQCTSYTGPTSIARDMMGHLECPDGGCCMCSEISCGLSPGMPCQDIQFGDFAAAGVQNIVVKGSLSFNTGSFGNFQQGAQINCNGQQSCRSARITGELIGEMQCSGWFGCNDAIIVINDPAPQFSLHCDGESGCAGADITINIKNCASFAELGQFQFNSPGAASGASITVNNYCPNPVIIEHLDCQHQGSCQGTAFRFNGNVQIQNCEIFGAAQLPPQCLGFGGNNFGGFPQFNPYPMPMPPMQQPQYPQFPPQQQYPPMLPPQQPLPVQPLPQPPMQQPPAQSPPAQLPPAQFPPQPVQPVAPPATPGTPGTPPQQPGTPATPGTPQQPAPGFGQPQQPTPGLPQQPTPGFGAPQQPLPNLFSPITGLGGQCEMPGQCRGLQTVALQSNRFELACIEPGSCGGMALTLNVPLGGTVDHIEAFRFESPFAAQGASITINSASFFNPVDIGRVICEVAQSCAGVTIKALGIDLGSLSVECREPGACTGGSINGISFDMLSGGNFQGGAFPQPGFGFPQQQPGFGAPQQLGFPQQPQQPGFGAPQQPGFPQQPQPGFPQQPQPGFPQQYNPYYQI